MVDEFAHAAFSSAQAHDVYAGDAFHLGHCVGGTCCEAYGAEQVGAVDVVAYVGCFGERHTEVVAYVEHGCEFAAVALALHEVVEAEFFGAGFDDVGCFGGDDAYFHSGAPEQLQAHTVAGVEFLHDVARGRVVHAAVGECAVDVGQKQSYRMLDVHRG